MNGRSTKSIARNINRPVHVRARRPFWLPAANYYLLTLAVATGFFFLAWGIMHDGVEETPWVMAGLGSLVILAGAVLLREVVLRRARNRYLLLQRNFDRQLNDVYSRIPADNGSEKLTIGQNADILRDIEKKSNAARTLGKLGAVHKEVFELCSAYLALNERELHLMGPGSPRLGPLRKSKDRVSRYHRFHMLQWAEIEVRDLTLEAKSRLEVSERVKAAQSAIGVIDEALEHYPSEVTLLESREVLVELHASIMVSDCVEKAERAAFSGANEEATRYYRDALYYLGRDNVVNGDRKLAEERINSEIHKIEMLQARD